MKKLYEVANLIRSKNAGPFVVTLDVIFPSREMYDRVLATGALDVERIGALYGLPEGRMKTYHLPLANAVKFSFPRLHPSGDFLDTDLYGCQMHAPLVTLDIPID